jgi:hypothetical protein
MRKGKYRNCQLKTSRIIHNIYIYKSCLKENLSVHILLFGNIRFGRNTLNSQDILSFFLTLKILETKNLILVMKFFIVKAIQISNSIQRNLKLCLHETLKIWFWMYQNNKAFE